jgi:hypothetical protein
MIVLPDRRTLVRWGTAVALAAGVAASAQQLPSEPKRQFGSGVTGAFEGWFDNPDGSRTFLVGYLNRNTTQTLDVPIGPNNRIEPGGPDMGQPTHFLPGRQWGVFSVAVPEEFTTPNQRLTWTIVANGQTTTIPLRLHPDYSVSPFAEVAVRNTPPVVRLDEQGPGLQGPVSRLAAAPVRTISTGSPLVLPIWVSDDAKYASGTMAVPRNLPPPVQISWSKYRGPGTVTFDLDVPPMQTLAGGGVDAPFRGRATATARFSEPGEYVLHALANDYSGEGGAGEVCCWTTALVRVTVTP